MTDKDLLFKIALRQVPQIGDVHARTLLQQYGTAENVFKSSIKLLEKTDGIGTVRARSIKCFKGFDRAEKEISFAEKYQINIWSHTDDRYPQRLLQCHDAPFVLYSKGNAHINASKMVAIVGTRSNTAYGKACCEMLIAELEQHDITIVSGLAYGIDTIAHRQSLKHQLPTIAVLAHGLDTIYPQSNRKLAMEIIENGSLLTEFMSGILPDKQNFPGRNRITAGLCDALVVIESGKKGGSLITADMALGYHRDVFAFPGRTIDAKSEGCNELIAGQKAQLISSAGDLLASMLWSNKKITPHILQTQLFQELNDDEKTVMKTIEQLGTAPIDSILIHTGISGSILAKILLSLEIKGMIKHHPGNQYSLM